MPRAEQPLLNDGSVLTEFAQALRDVRVAAGNPSYRALAARAHYSSTTLADAAGGKKLPSLAVTEAFVRACGADTAEWRRRWQETAAALAASASPQETTARCPDDDRAAPYLGLRSYRSGDAVRFHGREELVAQVRAAVADRRFVAVVGASGAGKSSLLHAGLIAEIEAAGHPVVAVTPGQRPVEEVAVALAAMSGVSATVLRQDIIGDPAGLHHAVRQLLAAREAEGDLLVVVDQFEELFTVCQDTAERAAFLAALITAATAETSRVRIVVGVRADFYVHCCAHPDLAEMMNGSAQVVVGPMTSDQLRAAVTGPAAAAGLSVESALLAELLAEAVGEPGTLPLVSHALLQTWRRRRGVVLTLAGYREAGGIRHALAETAETVYGNFDAAQRSAARELFLRLAAPGDGTEDTKRRLRRSEIDDPDLPEILVPLVAARLVVTDHDTVEIAHETLIRCWPRLRGWLDEDREGLRVHRRLTEAARDWEATRRDHGGLYRGTRLSVAREWSTRCAPRLNASEREFLETSVRVSARQVRRRKQFVVLGAVLLVLTLAFGVVAAVQRRDAVEQHDLAVSREMAARSASLAATQPEQAMLLALAAFRQAPTVEARSALLSIQASPFRGRINGTVPLWGIAMSPDGRVVATGSTAAPAVRLWDRATRREIRTLPAPVPALFGLAFSPDGRHLAAASGSALTDPMTVQLWDVATGRRTEIRTGRRGIALAVAFSPDGRLMAVAGSDGAVDLWDLPSGRVTGTLAGRGAAAYGVAFSRDGASILTTSDEEGIVREHDLRTGRESVLLSGLPGVTAVAVSPDGRTLATTTANEGVTRLWDTASRRQLLAVGGHTGNTLATAFAPDGRTLVTGGDDHTVAFWDVGEANDASAGKPVVDGDGTRAAAPRPDGVVRVWEVSTGRDIATIPASAAATPNLVFSGDGQHLAMSGMDGKVRLLDLGNGQETERSEDVRYGLALSLDGKTALSGAANSTVKLWDTATQTSTALTAGTGIQAMTFSPDRKLAAIANVDTTVSLWDVATGRRVAVLGGKSGSILAVRFSRDSSLLATAGSEGTIHVWNVASRQEVSTLRARPGSVFALAFDATATTLAAARADGTISLWDLPARRETAVVTGHPGPVRAVALSPDGHRLTTAGQDGTVRQWNTGAEEVAGTICATIGTELTAELWQSAIPDVQYRSPCVQAAVARTQLRPSAPRPMSG